MATISKSGPRVRPMPIGVFCERIETHYLNVEPPPSRTTRHRLHRVLKFLREHGSLKTTYDLDAEIVAQFSASCEQLAEPTRGAMLDQFRAICNLASIERSCFKRNPFESYSPQRAVRTPRGRKLDEDQVRSVLAHLKEGVGIWEGHRLYALTSTVIYAGIHIGEAIGLHRDNCDLALGVIRLPMHPNSKPDKGDRQISIAGPLKEILADWFPARLKGKPKRTAQCPFGSKLAEDGRTLIPHEAEGSVLAKMLQWREQGWTGHRIARELDTMDVTPRKGGSKWNGDVVNEMLQRAGQRLQAIDDVATEPRDDPGWVFPNVSGKGGTKGTLTTVTRQIREAGRALDIESMTFASLRRFYHENARVSLDLGSDRIEHNSPSRRCPIELRGEGFPPRVYGREIPRLTGIAYAIVDFAVERFDQGGGCTADELKERTGSASERVILSLNAKLKEAGFDPLRRVLHWDGKKGGILRVIDPGPQA